MSLDPRVRRHSIPNLGAVVTDGETATLSHSNQDTGQVYDFDGVERGLLEAACRSSSSSISWAIRRDTTEIILVSDSDGYFVQGLVATVEQMEAFAAGRVVGDL